jgi:hypothetical protein
MRLLPQRIEKPSFVAGSQSIHQSGHARLVEYSDKILPAVMRARNAAVSVREYGERDLYTGFLA